MNISIHFFHKFIISSPSNRLTRSHCSAPDKFCCIHDADSKIDAGIRHRFTFGQISFSAFRSPARNVNCFRSFLCVASVLTLPISLRMDGNQGNEVRKCQMVVTDNRSELTPLYHLDNKHSNTSLFAVAQLVRWLYRACEQCHSHRLHLNIKLNRC